MIRSNEHYAGLPGAYLFATVAAKVRAHREQHPALPVISLGIPPPAARRHHGPAFGSGRDGLVRLLQGVRPGTGL